MKTNISKIMQPNSALIHILSEYVDISTISNDGSVESKKVQHSDFLKVLTASMKSNLLSDDGFDHYTLGNNIIKFKASPEGFVYYFLVKKGKYPFNNEGRIRKIHYPNMLFKFTLDPVKNLRKTKVAIIKDSDLSEQNIFGVTSIFVKPKAILYKYQLGNVNGEGNVCWGGNSFKSLDTYNSLIEVVSTFFNSPSNLDHIDAVTKNEIDRKTFLKSLETEEYDENLLNKMNITFEKY